MRDGKKHSEVPDQASEAAPLRLRGWFVLSAVFGVLAAAIGGMLLLLRDQISAQAATIIAISTVLLLAGLGALTVGLHRVREMYRLHRSRINLIQHISTAFTEEQGTRSYRAMAAMLEQEFNCSHVVFGWIESWNSLAWLHSADESPHLIARQHWHGSWEELFRHGSVMPSGAGACPVDGEIWTHSLAVPITWRTEPLALILMGRQSKAFSPMEIALLSGIVMDLVPILYNRVQISRQDAVRRMTETAFHLSEARLRSILDESRDLVLTVGGAGLISYINPAGASLLGYPEPAGLRGRRAAELWYQAEEFDFFDQRIRDEHYIQDMEILLKDSAGGSHFCLASATAHLSGGGDFAEFTAMIKDISELVDGQKILTQANIELEEANRRLRETQNRMTRQKEFASIAQLAAGIAGEIAPPLSNLVLKQEAITAHLEVLKSFLAWLPGKSAPEIERWMEDWQQRLPVSSLGALVAESGLGLRWIGEFLSQLRVISSFNGNSDHELYDLNQGVRSTVMLAGREIKDLVRVEQSLNPLPPIWCRGSEINLVVLQLLATAAQTLQASGRPAGESWIEIRTWSEGGMVHCEVSGIGRGIEGGQAALPIEPSSSIGQPGQASGWGLAISRDIIVKRHGGRWEARSGPGQGRCFSFSLPTDGNATNP